jgi:hypothetical protein
LIKGIPTALVALAIGLVAAGIAWRQKEIAQAKLKLDLFDKRYTIFHSAWEFMSEIVHNGPGDQALHPFTNQIPQAGFLFGRDIEDYLNNATNKRTDLWMINQRVRRSADRAMPPEDIDRNAFLENWFFEQAAKGLKAKLAPYLDFEKWR